MQRLGLWLIGAGGYVGSLTALGLAAMRRGLLPRYGLVCEHEAFGKVDLIPYDRIELGGHEIRMDGGSLLETCAGFERSGLIGGDVLRRCRRDLLAGQRNLRPGTILGSAGPKAPARARTHGIRDATAAAAVERLTDDLRAFRTRRRLDQIVVINVARTEPVPAFSGDVTTWPALWRRLARSATSPLPTSSLYALAAIEAGCAYVNFTPSVGIDVPVLRHRADDLGLPYMGRDGKTGETLVKSVLAPLFVFRNLHVESWMGYNLLGNPDGQAMSDPKVRRAKQQTKDLTVAGILRHRPTTAVGIDFVASLGDRKVAWDFIHFRGFLGADMTMQFTWHGVDSLLAAPLILDLARLAELELRRGASGAMKHLACFFKAPMDVAEHALHRQWDMLVAHLGSASDPRRGTKPRPRKRSARSR